MGNIQIQMLLTYTVFHVGIYITLLAALFGIAIKDNIKSIKLRIMAFFLVVAGFSGGVIGANIPEFSNYDDFVNARLRIWCCETWNYKFWSSLEHNAFWCGIILVCGFYIFEGPRSFIETNSKPKNSKSKLPLGLRKNKKILHLIRKSRS